MTTYIITIMNPTKNDVLRSFNNYTAKSQKSIIICFRMSNFLRLIRYFREVVRQMVKNGTQVF